jgi:type II secretory pathway component PulJ
MVFKLTNRRKPAAGFTLVEFMVGAALGMLLLAAVGAFYLFSLTSFASVANFSELNRKGRYACDLISRDIRSAYSVSSATPDQLVLHFAKTDVAYTYDSDQGTLTRSQFGQPRLLLKGVDYLTFSLYQRPLTNSAYEVFPTATPATAKLVAFEWSCSQRVYRLVRTSQSLQGAIVELRNQ